MMPLQGSPRPRGRRPRGLIWTALGGCGLAWEGAVMMPLQFTINFVHLPGKENIVADTLSRLPTLPPAYTNPPPPLPINATLPISLFPMPLSYLDMAKAQSTCPSIPSLLQQSSLNITTVPLSPELSILGDVSIPIFRPLVPISFQKQGFEHVNSLGHPGIQATRRLLSSRFVWSHMAADIAIWTCQS